MSDSRQSLVLDELASFFVSQSDFEFEADPAKAPAKVVTPQTSDSEPDPPLPTVDPAIVLELKNFFLSNSTTAGATRRAKASLRKSITGPSSGERKPRRSVPSSSRSLAPMPSSSHGTTRESDRRNSDSRSVMLPSSGVSVNDDAMPSARERRSRSMSFQRSDGAASTALERHLAQTSPIIRAPDTDIADQSVVSNARRRRKLGSEDGTGITVTSSRVSLREKRVTTIKEDYDAPARPRSFSGRGWEFPAHSKSIDMAGIVNSSRFHGRDTMHKLQGDDAASVDDLHDDNDSTTLVPLNDEDYQETNNRKNRSSSRGKRRTPSRSKSDDLTELSTSRRGNDRGDVPRRRRRNLEGGDNVEADPAAIADTEKSIVELKKMLSDPPVSSPLLSLGESRVIVMEHQNQNAPSKPRSFSDRGKDAPVRSKSSDLASWGNTDRSHGRDTRRKLHGVTNGEHMGEYSAISADLNDDKNMTTRVLLNGEGDNDTNNHRSRRRTPNRSRSDDLTELSTSRRGNDRGDAPRRKRRPHEGKDSSDADNVRIVHPNKSLAQLKKIISKIPSPSGKVEVKGAGTYGASLDDKQAPLKDSKHHSNTPSKPRSFSTRTRDTPVRSKSSDVASPGNVSRTHSATHGGSLGDHDAGSLYLDDDERTAIPLNDEDERRTNNLGTRSTSKVKRRTPSRSKSDDLTELSTSRRGNDRGDTPRRGRRHQEERDNSEEGTTKIVHREESVLEVDQILPKAPIASANAEVASGASYGAILGENPVLKEGQHHGAPSRPRSFSERRKVAPEVEDGMAHPLRHRTNHQTNGVDAPSKNGMGAEKHTGGDQRRSQPFGRHFGSSAHGIPGHSHQSSRMHRGGSSGTLDYTSSTDSDLHGIMSGVSLDDQSSASKKLEDANSRPQGVAADNPDPVAYTLDGVSYPAEPSHQTESPEFHLHGKKVVKPSSSIFKGFMQRRSLANEKIGVRTTMHIEPQSDENITTEGERRDKTNEKKGISVLKNLIKGSADEKKGPRWGVIKASIDVTHVLKRTSSTERKRNSLVTETANPVENEEEHINRKGASSMSQGAPNETQDDMQTSQLSQAMMMSFSNFAPEDVDGLEDFHANLATMAKPAAEEVAAVSANIAVTKSRSGEDPPTRDSPRREDKPFPHRRRVMGGIDPPAMHLKKSRQIVMHPADAPDTIEESADDDKKDDREADGRPLTMTVPFDQLVAKKDMYNEVEKSMFESTSTFLSSEGDYEPASLLSPMKFMQLDFNPSMSPSKELGISIHAVDDANLAHPTFPGATKVQRRNSSLVVDDPLLEEERRASVTGLMNKVDGRTNVHADDSVPDEDVPDPLEIEYEYLHRQLAASVARTKASRDAIRSLRHEIDLMRKHLKQVKRERDATMKTVQERKITLEL